LQESLYAVFLLLLRSCLSSCVALFSSVLFSDVRNRCQALQSLRFSSIFLFCEDTVVEGIGYVGVFGYYVPACSLYFIVENFDCGLDSFFGFQRGFQS
jgi:hypothetical protein